MARDDDKLFMTRSLNVTPKTTEQHLIVCSYKSVAYVTNKKCLRSHNIAARRDECSRKVAKLFLREPCRSKRVRERSRALLELTRAAESAPVRALLN